MFAILRKVSRVNLSYLEQQLEKATHPFQQLDILKDLTFHYIYRHIEKAEACLHKQELILQKYPHKEHQLYHLLFHANLENQRHQYMASREWYQKTVDMVEEYGDVMQIIEVYLDFAGLLINLLELENAQTYIDKSAKYLLSFPNKLLEFRMKCRQGTLFLSQQKYEPALSHLLEAQETLYSTDVHVITIKDVIFMSQVYSGMGFIYEFTNDKEKAIRAYQLAVDLSESESLFTRISYHYLNLGKIFIATDDYTHAEAYFKKALEHTDVYSPLSRAGALANLGYCYYNDAKFDEALKCYNQAERIYKASGVEEKKHIAVIASFKAKLYLTLGKAKKAEIQLVEALKQASETNDLKLLVSIAQDIATFYFNLGDYRNAYHYQKKHSLYAQKYYEELHTSHLAELDARYRSEKRENELQLLRLQATTLQGKALRAQMNPHFMYNALNAIQHFISIDEPDTAMRYLAQFARLMRQSLNNSEFESVSLEEDIDFLYNYLSINQKLRFGDRLQFEIEVDEEIEEDIMNVPAMIVQPYVENALEHGLRPRQKGTLRIRYHLYNDQVIQCVVEDDGVGREQSRLVQMQNPKYRTHRSMGTLITEKRLSILHNHLQLDQYVHTEDLYDPDTGAPTGTRVTILLPILEVTVHKIPEIMQK